MNKRLILSLGLLILLLSAGWVGAPSAQAVPRNLMPVGAPSAQAVPNASFLVINEVFAPSVAAPNNQYFELYNGSNNAIDLSSYVVFNSGGSDALNVLPNPTIAARSLLVVSASQLGGQIGSGLNPASDFLALVQRGATDTVIDVVNWGPVNPNWPNYAQFAGYFFVSNAPTMPTDGMRSLQRYPNGFDSDQPTDFVALPSSPAQPVPTYTPTPNVTATATPTGIVPTATPTPFCMDGYEPDGSIGQATTLALNTEQTHTICPSADNDFFSITVVSNKVYSIYTKDLGGSLDTIIAILDSRGTKIAENDDQPACICSRIDMVFPSNGTYYVRVRDNRNLGGIGWVYTVGFSVTPGPAPTGTATVTTTPDPNAPTATATMAPCSDPYENDGVPAAAHLLLIGEVQPGHTFCPGGDADWYRFFGGRGKAYTIQTSGLGIGVDTYLYLFDSDGQTVLAQNDDAPAPPACTSPGPPNCPNDAVASSLDFFPIRDDFYYIMVKNKGDLGAPFMNYNVTFRVRANVPVPALTPSPIIAPVVTVTVPAPPPISTNPPIPTNPPISTNPPIPTNPPGGATATEVPPAPTEVPPAPTDVPPAPTDVP
ncbi:MAG: pre-peptidase C-terminal domain-containing protein, partial [Chloroflexota bacterium]|nr:pre-peptidase C-terminal domain-containing protein [Chloroflexota bacterium]